MQSPTTLLSSIQQMKSKLRNDKQILMDIKNDFTKFNKKANPYVANEQQSFLITDISQIDMNKSTRNSNSIDRNQSIIKMKKEHQREISKLKEQHQKQINQLLRIKGLEMEDIQNQYKAKLQDLGQYIAILENQIAHPKNQEIQKNVRQQYDSAIKNLIQENNRLYQDSKSIKEENDRLKQLCNQFQNQKSMKSRFKFTKVKRDESQIQYQSEKPKITRFRTNSLTLNNDQNINRTNILNSKQWEDAEINEDQLKLKTIRQFQKQPNDLKANRKKLECYQSLKI